MTPRNVIALVGSLRSRSFNAGLCAAAAELAPAGMTIARTDLGALPLYNADLDTDALRPAPVVALKRAIAEADALLVVSPEYNHGIPGVMQNAIDWASRPGMRSPLAGKPVAIMGASGGPVGTARGQQVLKLVLMSTLAHVFPHPGVAVGQSADKFDGEGRLVHQPTREFIARFLAEYAAYVERFVGSAGATAHHGRA